MKKTFIITFTLVFIASLKTEASASEAQIIENYGNIPLAFTLNRGQVDSQVKFTTQGNGCSLFFTPAGTTFLLSRETEESRAKRAAKRSVVYINDPLADSEPDIELEHFALKLNFLNANPAPEITGEDRLSWNSNYFIGNDPSQWQTDVPNYSKIRIKDVYKGIDLVYYGGRKSIKYDFVVQPGENTSEIMLKYDFGGSEGLLSINEKGELVVSTPFGDIIERKPFCYQIIEDEKKEIDISYKIIDSLKGSFRFKIGDYNHDYSLIIDPEIVYSTFIGGSSADEAYSIDVDMYGNAYVTGFTWSTDFPVTSGALDETFNGGDDDAFVLKMNADGSSLVYASFLGGSDDDNGQSIEVDTDGNTYITGYTKSTDFPVTSGAFNETNNGTRDVFICKLNSEGNNLVYSTFAGGKHYDWGQSIAIDSNGNAYVTGFTESTAFPVTSGAFDEIHNGGYRDAFVLKLNSNGSDIIYATYIGGSEWDIGLNISVDGNSIAYVVGDTGSTDFPVTSGAYDETYNGEADFFVLKLDSEGRNIVYSTFVGGSDNDYGRSIAVNENGSAFVGGYTSSIDFPVTSGAFDETHNGWGDVYIVKINADGSGLDYATYIGGSGSDFGYGLDVDLNGNAYATGRTESTDFPVTPGAFDETYNGGYNDTYILRLNADGSNIDYATFLGGSNSDYGNDIILDTNGNAFITGYTKSTDFSITPGAFDDSLNTSEDIFIVKFSFEDVGYVFETIPSSFRVNAPYPNPFNPSVTLEYEIPASCFVKLVIYDILGREMTVIKNGFVTAGTYRTVWNGRDSNGDIVGGGVYIYRFEADNYVINGKILFLK